MKTITTILSAIILMANTFAQAPQKMSYQTVLRDAGGVLLSNQAVGIKISILRGSPAGSISYSEIFSPNPTTNINGLLSLQIGSGIAITGLLDTINWGNGSYYIKTETDPSGGTSYTISGTSQLLSVPYALYSANGGTTYSPGTGINISGNIISNTISGLDNLTDVISAGATTGQVLKYNGANWVPGTDSTSGGSINVTTRLSGNGTIGSPLDIAGQGATSGKVLKWNGTSWAPGTDTSGWGLAGNAGTTAGNFLGTTDNLALRLRTNNLERFIIDNAGKVGIGTSIPSSLLTVGGLPSAGVTTPTSITMDGSWNSGTPAFDKLKFYIYKSGIEGYGFGLGNINDLQYWAGGSLTGIHRWFTSRTERMRIDEAGNVGIGVSIPQVKLEVGDLTTTNKIRLNSDYLTDNGFELNIPNGFNSFKLHCSGIYIRFAYSEDNFGTVADQVLIDPNYSFRPAEDDSISLGDASYRWTEVWATNGTIQTSDIRHKKNVNDINYGLSAVMKMRPVSYEWKNEKLKVGTGTSLGFIAQDLEKIVPDVVVHTINGKDKETGAEPKESESYGVKYSELTPVVVKAIQEQQQQIEILKAENLLLKNSVVDLQAKMKSFETKLNKQAK